MIKRLIFTIALLAPTASSYAAHGVTVWPPWWPGGWPIVWTMYDGHHHYLTLGADAAPDAPGESAPGGDPSPGPGDAGPGPGPGPGDGDPDAGADADPGPAGGMGGGGID